MFSKCLANELIGDGIRVNARQPRPGADARLAEDREAADRRPGHAPGRTTCRRSPTTTRRSGGSPRPDEIANFFVFLCSPRASYCVGSTYYIDGGWLGSVG